MAWLRRLVRSSRENWRLGALETGFLWSEAGDGGKGRIHRVERDGRPKCVHPDAATGIIQANVWELRRGDFRDGDYLCFTGRDDCRIAGELRAEKDRSSSEQVSPDWKEGHGAQQRDAEHRS